MCAKKLLVLGTFNRKKGLELAEALGAANLELRTLADFPEALAVVEDGDTFAANATLKAVVQAQRLGHWVLGEDSGLVVDALGGAPGVFSARYAGEQASDEANNQLLLDGLGRTPLPQRSAHYVCHMVVADPGGGIRAESAGICRGRIVFSPRGSNGFGYDPLFEIREYHRTFGELSPLVKQCLSHRARAARALLPRLRVVVQFEMR